MCLAVPAKILNKIATDQILCEGRVDFGGGVIRTVNLSFVPEAQEGDYILVHAGVAITRLQPEDAERRRELIASITIDRGAGHAEQS